LSAAGVGYDAVRIKRHFKARIPQGVGYATSPMVRLDVDCAKVLKRQVELEAG